MPCVLLTWPLWCEVRRLKTPLDCFGDCRAGVEGQKQRGPTLERGPKLNILPEFLGAHPSHSTAPPPELPISSLSRWLCYLLSCSSPKYFDSFLSTFLSPTTLNSLAGSIIPSCTACARPDLPTCAASSYSGVSHHHRSIGHPTTRPSDGCTQQACSVKDQTVSVLN